jgi:hypothetical protein
MSGLRNKDNQFFIINIQCPTQKNGTLGTGGTPRTPETLYPLLMHIPSSQ